MRGRGERGSTSVKVSWRSDRTPDVGECEAGWGLSQAGRQAGRHSPESHRSSGKGGFRVWAEAAKTLPQRPP